MKLNKLWVALLALVALTACNKDLEPSHGMDEPKTKLVDVTISTSSDEELRGLFDRDESTGAVGKLRMIEENVNLYIAVKKGDTGTPVYQTCKFTKIKGENRAVFRGQLKVPGEGTGDYKIASILLSEDNGLVYASVREGKPQEVQIVKTAAELVASTGQTIEAKVPYYTDWADCKLTDGVLNPITLKFKPEGTLLRLQIINETESVQNLKSITFTTTAFRAGGNFFLDTYEGGRPGLSYDHTPEMKYTFPASTELQKKSSGAGSKTSYYYIWVTPLGGGNVPLETIADIELVDGTKKSAVFSTKQALQKGSVPLRIRIKDNGVDADFDGLEEQGEEFGAVYKLPTEYFAQYDVNLEGNGFVKNHNNSDNTVGYFKGLEAIQHFKTPVSIEGQRYSLHTSEELLSLISPYREGTLMSGDQTRLNVLESNIKLGNLTRTYTADYAAKPGRLCYAVRFKSNSNGMRTAFRYKYEGNGDMKRLEIKCRYLGNSSTTLQDISNEAYWTDVEPFIVSFRGYYNESTKEYKERGSTSYFWTSSSYSFRGMPAAFINQYTARVWGFDKNILKYPVRLYKRD